eukprot:12407539-Karenia_brevis.AAC.1
MVRHPLWIRTIHGAEVWALYAAAMHSMSGVAYRSDCLEVVEAFQRGIAWATRATSQGLAI